MVTIVLFILILQISVVIDSDTPGIPAVVVHSKTLVSNFFLPITVTILQGSAFFIIFDSTFPTLLSSVDGVMIMDMAGHSVFLQET